MSNDRRKELVKRLRDEGVVAAREGRTRQSNPHWGMNAYQWLTGFDAEKRGMAEEVTTTPWAEDKRESERLKDRDTHGFNDYTEGSTGGGFVAYFRDMGDVRVMLTCSEDESRLPAPDEKIDVLLSDRQTGLDLNVDDEFRSSGLTLAEAQEYIQSFIAARQSSIANAPAKASAKSRGMSF